MAESAPRCRFLALSLIRQRAFSVVRSNSRKAQSRFPALPNVSARLRCAFRSSVLGRRNAAPLHISKFCYFYRSRGNAGGGSRLPCRYADGGVLFLCVTALSPRHAAAVSAETAVWRLSWQQLSARRRILGDGPWARAGFGSACATALKLMRAAVWKASPAWESTGRYEPSYTATHADRAG